MKHIVVFLLIIIVMCLFTDCSVKNTERKTDNMNNDSLIALGTNYKEEARERLMNELFIYYVDSLQRIGYGNDWAVEKAAVELELKSVSIKYVTIIED